MYDKFMIKKMLDNILVDKVNLTKNRIPAAVLIIIYFKDCNPYILLIKRSKHLKNHASQISFPGGVKEEGEELIDTAIRETKEEVGIELNKDDIVGMLPSVDTFTSNFCIVPFIAIINSIKDIKINKNEIESVIEAHLIKLLVSRTKINDHYIFKYEDQIVWGATARILNMLYNVFNIPS